MLLCAHYILPITSEPIQRGAGLVRDGRIYDVGPVDILKAHYPEEEVKDFCRGKIARHKIPKYIFFVDTFPMTGSGKIQKFKLKDLALELLARQGVTPV